MSAPDDPRDPGSVPADELDELDAPGAPGAPDPLDDLASALLDGEAAGAEAARAAEPDVAARVRAFARVRDAVAEPVPPVDDADRDRTIAAALAAWGTASPTAVPSRTDDLAARRAPTVARSRRSLEWVRPLGIAAAVIALIAVGGVALQGTDDDDSGDMAASSDETTEALDADDTMLGDAGSDAGTEGGGEGTGGPGGGMASPPGVVVLPGDYTSADELVAGAVSAVNQQRSGSADEPTYGNDDHAGGDEGDGEESTPAPASEEATTASPTQPCPSPPEVTIGTARATFEGRPVVVFIIDEGATDRVVIVDEADCALIDERSVPG